MKNILFFTHHLGHGGAEKAVRTLARYLHERAEGFESYVCVVYDDPAFHPETDNLLVLTQKSDASTPKYRKPWIISRQIAELRQLKRQYAIDCCISFLPGADLINVSSGVGEKQIVSVRNRESLFVKSVFKKWYVQYAYRRCDHIVAVTEAVRRDCIAYFGVPEQKITTIYNALPEFPAQEEVVLRQIEQERSGKTAAAAPAQEEVALRQAEQERGGKTAAASPAQEGVGAGGPVLHGLPRKEQELLEQAALFGRGHRVLINVARLAPEKGQDTLLRAMQLVSARDPEVRLMILGDGPRKQELQELAAALGLEGKVYWAGSRPRPQNYLRLADVFVLSSVIEGMPNALLEAMQCGVPCVSTECGAREILAPDTDPLLTAREVDEARYGILVPVGSAEMLAEAIERMLADSALRERYRRIHQERLKALSLESIGQQWIDIISNA